MQQMKKFDRFLEKVKEANPDEFSELQDILSRHRQLQGKNWELHETQKKYTHDLDKKTKDLTSYIKDMETEKITINNRMSQQQQELEGIDNLKSQLLAERDENAKQKSQKETETGKLLMSIDNLYNKCQKERGDMITSTKDIKKKEYEDLKGFDNTTKSGMKSVEQLKIIM